MLILPTKTAPLAPSRSPQATRVKVEVVTEVKKVHQRVKMAHLSLRLVQEVPAREVRRRELRRKKVEEIDTTKFDYFCPPCDVDK